MLRHLHRFFRRLAFRRADAFPRKVVVDRFAPTTCTFEVTSPVEVHRVGESTNEDEFVSILLDDLAPNDILYDVGACIGFISVHAAARGARVIAFEPDPAIRKRLQTNLSLNNVESLARVEEFAIADTSGHSALHTDGTRGLSPSLRDLGRQKGVTEVYVETIDNLVHEANFPPPTAVKVDVEGAEVAVLRGMKRLLTSQYAPKALYIEVHPDFLPTFGDEISELYELLSTANYEILYDSPRRRQIHLIARRHPSRLDEKH